MGEPTRNESKRSSGSLVKTVSGDCSPGGSYCTVTVAERVQALFFTVTSSCFFATTPGTVTPRVSIQMELTSHGEISNTQISKKRRKRIVQGRRISHEMAYVFDAGVCPGGGGTAGRGAFQHGRDFLRG